MALPVRHDLPIVPIKTYDLYGFSYVPDLPYIPYELKHLIPVAAVQVANVAANQSHRNAMRMVAYNLLVNNHWANQDFTDIVALVLDKTFELQQQQPGIDPSRIIPTATDQILLGYSSYLLKVYPDLVPLYPNRNALGEVYQIAEQFAQFAQMAKMRRQGGGAMPQMQTMQPTSGYPQQPMQPRKMYSFNYGAFVQAMGGMQLNQGQVDQIEFGNFNVVPGVTPTYIQNFITAAPGTQAGNMMPTQYPAQSGYSMQQPMQTQWQPQTGGQTRFSQPSVGTFGTPTLPRPPGSDGVPGSATTVRGVQEERWNRRAASPQQVAAPAPMMHEIQRFTPGGFEDAIPVSHKRINLSDYPEPEPIVQPVSHLNRRPIHLDETISEVRPAVPISIELPPKKKPLETTGGSEMDRSKHKIMIGGVYPLDTPSRFERFARSVDKFAEQVDHMTHPKPEVAAPAAAELPGFDTLHDLSDTVADQAPPRILTEEDELKMLEEESNEGAVHPHYLLDSNIEDCITASRIKMLEALKDDEFIYTVPCIVVNPIATTINVAELMAKIGQSKDLVEYALNCRSLLSKTSIDPLGHDTVSYLLTMNARLTDIVNDYLKNKLKTGIKIEGVLDDIGDLSTYLTNQYGLDYATAFEKFSMALCLNVFREQDDITMRHIEENLAISEGVSVGTFPLDYTITHTKMLSAELGIEASIDLEPQEVNALDTPILYKLIRTLHRYKVEKQINTVFDLLVTADGVRYKIWWDHFHPVTYYVSKYTGL